MPKIMVIEDDEDVRSVVVECLEFYSMNVSSFDCAQKALEELAKNSDYDLVLTDISMPEMSGLQFIEEYLMRFQSCHIPIVVLSAHSEVERIVEALRMGADDFVNKPFQNKDLVDRILKIVQVGKRRREQHKLVLGMEKDKREKYLQYEKMNALFRISNNKETKKRAA